MDVAGLVRKPGLLKHGDITAIAREAGQSVQHVSQVLRGYRPANPRLQRAIARMTAKRTAELYAESAA